MSGMETRDQSQLEQGMMGHPQPDQCRSILAVVQKMVGSMKSDKSD